MKKPKLKRLRLTCKICGRQESYKQVYPNHTKDRCSNCQPTYTAAKTT